MFRRLAFVIAVLWIGVLANSAKSENYFYFTDFESTIYGETVRFFSGDTIWSTLRSNDPIHVLQHPVFMGRVIIGGGPWWNQMFEPWPEGLDSSSVFNANSMIWPVSAPLVRLWATEQNNFFAVDENVRARVVIQDHALRITWGAEGTPFDTSEFEIYDLEDSSVVFFDCYVQLSGEVTGTLILGASEDIGLEDNIKYSCVTDLTQPVIPPDCESKLAIVSEQNIVILNTVANGRDNSNGSGNGQTNQNFTSIVITGMLAALDSLTGTLTFDEQNDLGDPYQGPVPDDRGRIHLIGSTAQRHRGYMHRSNHGSTGYLRDYHYDERLRDWDFGVYNNYVPVVTPPELSFGEIEVGDTAFMTVELTKLYWGVTIDSLDIAQPFFVSLIEDGAFSQIATVGFAPQIECTVSDSVHFHLEYFTTSVPLSGIGSPDLSSEEPKVIPASLEILAYPNPFNPETRISIELSEQSSVQLDIYDLQGRLVTNLLNESLSIGRYETRFNGINLSGGVYFARLEAGNITKTTKLLLLK